MKGILRILYSKISFLCAIMLIVSACDNEIDKETIKVNLLESAQYKFDNNLEEEAIEYCNKALAVDSLFTEALLLKIQSKYRLKQFDDYLNDLNKLLLIDTLNYLGYLYRADYYSNFSKKIEAISDYKKAISMDPLNVEAIGLLGNCFNDYSMKDSALVYFNKCIEIDPNSAWCYNQRGSYYAINKNFVDAYEDLQKAIAIDSTYPYPLYNLGMLKYSWLKKHREGCADMSKAIELGYAGSTEYYDERCGQN